MNISPEYLAKSGSEHGEQSALFCWINMARLRGFECANNTSLYGMPWVYTDNEVVPELRWAHAIPNGGGRTAAQGGQLKSEGVKGGVADVFLPVPTYWPFFGDLHPKGVVKYCGLYIEMKKAKGVPSSLTSDQLDFGAFVTKHGYLWMVCYGWKQATTLVQAYLEDTPYPMSPHQQKVIEKIRTMLSGN